MKSLNIDLNKFTYCSEINRKRPTAFIIMIDQSTSMRFEKIAYKGSLQTYAYIVADMVNSFLNELIYRCTKSEGVRDYFDICVIGYGGKSAVESNILWEGNLAGKDWVKISELKENAQFEKRTVENSIRGKIKTQDVVIPYWFKPVANYKTPMGHAFEKAHELINSWTVKNKDSYPPVVINITDGFQTDYSNTEILEVAQKIQALNTHDGNVLVLNSHIAKSGTSQFFPYDVDLLGQNKNSELLFKMSSIMPETFNKAISAHRGDTEILERYRGMTFNASINQLLNFIDIGTSGVFQQLTAR